MSGDTGLERVLAHYRHPHHFGEPTGATHASETDNPQCGDRIRMAFVVDGGRIVDLGFTGEGCAITTAAASMLSDRLAGGPVDAVSAWTTADMVAMLDMPVGPARIPCAVLPLHVAQEALTGTSAVAADLTRRVGP